MSQSNIRIIKDFRDYFLKLSEYNEIRQFELNNISTSYKNFYDYVTHNNYTGGELNQTIIKRILQKILENLRRQDIDIDDPVRNEILQLHSDLFL